MIENVLTFLAGVMCVIGAIVTIFSFLEHLEKRPRIFSALRRAAIALTTGTISTIIGSTAAIFIFAYLYSPSPVDKTGLAWSAVFALGCLLYGGALGAVYGLKNYFLALGLLGFFILQFACGCMILTCAGMLAYNILSLALQFIYPKYFIFRWTFIPFSLVVIILSSVLLFWAAAISSRSPFAEAKYLD